MLLRRGYFVYSISYREFVCHRNIYFMKEIFYKKWYKMDKPYFMKEKKGNRYERKVTGNQGRSIAPN